MGVVLVHTVSFCTRDIEANRCLSLILAWSTDYASEQSTLDIEENHQNQKAGENLIEQGYYLPVLASGRT